MVAGLRCPSALGSSGVRAPPSGGGPRVVPASAHVPRDLSVCCRATVWSLVASTILGSTTQRRCRAGRERPARAQRTLSSRRMSCWWLRGHSECRGRVGRPCGGRWCPAPAVTPLGTASSPAPGCSRSGPKRPRGRRWVRAVLGAVPAQEDLVPAWVMGRQRAGWLLAEGSAEGSGGWEHGPGEAAQTPPCPPASPTRSPRRFQSHSLFLNLRPTRGLLFSLQPLLVQRKTPSVFTVCCGARHSTLFLR